MKIFSLLLLLSLFCIHVGAGYQCGCMNITVQVDYDNDDKCQETVKFWYYFDSSTVDGCKDISNVVFGGLRNDSFFYDLGECITEVGPDHSPGCNNTLFANPWKFDFADNCFNLSFTVTAAKSGITVNNGTIQYKAGRDCFHCILPIPEPCDDDDGGVSQSQTSIAERPRGFLWI